LCKLLTRNLMQVVSRWTSKPKTEVKGHTGERSSAWKVIVWLHALRHSVTPQVVNTWRTIFKTTGRVDMGRRQTDGQTVAVQGKIWQNESS